MPLSALSVAPGVYLAAGPILDLRSAAELPADQPGPRLPAWRQREHRASRALLRRLLAEVTDPDAAAARLVAGLNGKPFLAGRPDVTISLSHTDGWIAAAVSTLGMPIGIDIQRPMPVSDALVRRCCPVTWRRELARLSQRARDLELAWIWSVQEACVKATGAGLAGRPWAIAVRPRQRAGTWGEVRWRALRGHFALPVSCAYGHERGAP